MQKLARKIRGESYRGESERKDDRANDLDDGTKATRSMAGRTLCETDVYCVIRIQVLYYTLYFLLLCIVSLYGRVV